MSDQPADQQSARANLGPHPFPEALTALMRTGWAPAPSVPAEEGEAAPYRRARRARLASAFPGEVLVIPSGVATTRNHDVTHRFRPGSDAMWLAGSKALGAVVVIDADGHATLYQQPPWDREDSGWYRDYHGELADGPRPRLEDVARELGIDTAPRTALDDLKGTAARVLRGLDQGVEELFVCDPDSDHELAVWLSEARLLKDEWEVAQVQLAVDATVRGFEDVVAEMHHAVATSERWIEGTFGRRARVDGNDVGYLSICAAGGNACTLHHVDNAGLVQPGDLVLLDMGVEGHELYTADITRTLPVSGRFTPLQRRLYDLVYTAQEAALAQCHPGNPFRAPYDAAMRVLAHGLSDLGLLEDAEASLAEDDRRFVRWTLHRVNHMLGLDVHDCGNARAELYGDGTLQPGHVMAVEPGLYFRTEDLLVPEELRGIGIRIEDNVVITEHGHRLLSAALPRRADEVETWMARLRERGATP